LLETGTKKITLPTLMEIEFLFLFVKEAVRRLSSRQSVLVEAPIMAGLT